MDEAFEGLFNRLFREHTAPDVLVGNVFRGTLIGFRIAMILCVLRHAEQGADLLSLQSIEASWEDVEAARLLAIVYAEHSLLQALELAPNLGVLPDLSGIGGTPRMTGEQRAFFDALPACFTRAEARTIWKSQGKADSTGGYWLKRFVDEKLLRKPSTGHYEKNVIMESLESLKRVRKGAKNEVSSLERVLERTPEPLERDPSNSNVGQSLLQSNTNLFSTNRGTFPRIPKIPADLIVFDDE
jgi:hypothetical protein